jgi:16S rRNA G1207 methylase RsmC
MSIKISDTGDNLLVTGADESQVNATLQRFVARGAQILGLPNQVGSNWTASCTKPADFYSELASLTLGEPHIPNQNIFEAVSISDTGKQLIISGKTKQAVQLALDELQKLGARNISSVAQLGNNWMATCEDPPGEKEECTVDTFGPQVMVTGPSKAAVESKIRDLTEINGRVVTTINQNQEGKWVAVIDNSGHKTW